VGESLAKKRVAEIRVAKKSDQAKKRSAVSACFAGCQPVSKSASALQAVSKEPSQFSGFP